MPVSIEAAGDHGFDLTHLCKSGGETLVKFLLQKAGFDEKLNWRVRVNQKQTCSGMTPPVSVIRYLEWGVVLRIKPGDNNTCHNVTVMFPSGFKAAEIFHKLRSVEKGFNRNWRKSLKFVKKPLQDTKIAPMISLPIEPVTVVETPVAAPIVDHVVEVSEQVAQTTMETQKLNVTDFLRNADNVKAICLNIYEMEEMPSAPWRNSVEFTAELCKRLGVAVNNSRQSGAMMRTVVFRGLVKKVMVGNKQTGYALTHKGRDFIKVDLYPELVAGTKTLENKIKKSVTPQTLREIGSLAGDIFHLSIRLKEIEAERAQLQQKIDALNREEEELCILHNAEIETFLSSMKE